MTTEKKAIGERRIETQQMKDRLLQLNEGDIATYTELSQIAGVDVQVVKRYLLTSAIKAAEQDGSRLFGVVSGEGIKRLDPHAQANELDIARHRIRRRAKASLRRSQHIEWDKLSKEDRDAVNASRSMFHFVAQATTNNAAKAIAGAVAKTGDALPFAKTLEQFK